MEVGALSNIVAAQVVAAEASSEADIALLAEATEVDQTVVTSLLEALPMLVPSVDPNLGRNLDVYA